MNMKLKIFCLAILPFIFSCSTGKMISENDQKEFNEQTHIGLQFSRNGDCCFETRDCEGLWDRSKQSIFLSGLLIRKDSIGTIEQLNISINGIDLKKTSFPHIINDELDESAIVGWYNEAEVKREKFLCSEADSSCEFQGNVKRDKIKLVLTKFQNNVLEGRFEGRIFLKGTGNIRFVKTSEYKDIVDGSFRINLDDASRISGKNLVAEKR